MLFAFLWGVLGYSLILLRECPAGTSGGNWKTGNAPDGRQWSMERLLRKHKQNMGAVRAAMGRHDVARGLLAGAAESIDDLLNFVTQQGRLGRIEQRPCLDWEYS